MMEYSKASKKELILKKDELDIELMHIEKELINRKNDS